jgi:molybdopterin-biosynthesis enzyme MoeA-like protein
VLVNPAGLAPRFVADGVYVLPGIPEEMRAAFETVADEFDVVDPDSARRDGS